METEFKIGDILEAEVTRITDFGAFVKINGRGGLGLIHISQIADSFVKDVNQHLKVGERVKARVIKLGPGKKIDLSLKSEKSKKGQEKGQAPFANRRKNSSFATPSQRSNSGFKSSDLEEKLQEYLRTS